MITCRYLLCAESVIRDGDTNVLTVVNILEEITPLGLPFLIPKLTIVSALEREQTDPEIITIALSIAIETDEVFQQSVEIDFQSKLRTRAILTINGMALRNYGTMVTKLQRDGRNLCEYVIQVNPPQMTTKPLL